MRRLKNILVVNDYDYINGGSSQVAILTANALQELGCQVTFFSAVSDPQKADLHPGIIRYTTGQQDMLQDANKAAALFRGIWNRKAADELSRLLTSYSPDDTVIHLHGWIKALTSSIGRALAQSPFAVVTTLHDYFIACPNGGFYNYPANTICHLRPLSAACICSNCDSRSYPYKVWRLIRQQVQVSAGKMPWGIKHYITVTDFSQQILRPFLPEEAELHLLPSPVSHVPEGEAPAGGRGGHLLCIGRLSVEKGVALACAAARKAGSRLRVIGDGALRESLEKEYPEVEFTGWLPQDKVFSEMQRATALVYPSLLYETQGLSVIEALSAGLPVIVPDQCAASEFVDGQNGLLFKRNDADDLASKIRTLSEDPALAAKMSHYAYEKYWRQPYSTQRYVRGLLDIYTKILAGPEKVSVQVKHYE